MKEYFKTNVFKCVIAGFIGALLLVGFGAAGYVYADSPAFCGSCHSMQEAHAAWLDSNHKNISCAECHLPHDSLGSKLAAKAKTGMNDTYHEIMRDYPVHIQVSDAGKSYINDNCLRCHESTMEIVSAHTAGEQNCLKCHSSVAHGSNKIEGGVEIE